MLVTVIIPTYNEAEHIVHLLQHLRASGAEMKNVIVTDGGSSDDTLALAANEGVIATRSPIKGRAGQMNHGADIAKGDVLHFIHADTLPPTTSMAIIAAAIKNGADHGSFRTRFAEDRLLLRLNAFFTRFDRPFVRGGDQSIWVTKDLFERVGRYRSEMKIMEEYDLLKRLRSAGTFHLSKETTLISARKYENNSWLRVQLANLTAVRMYNKGVEQEDIVRKYQSMLNYRPNAFGS